MSVGAPALNERDVVAVVGGVLAACRQQSVTVAADDRLEDLGLDSLEMAELFVALEERLGYELDPDSAQGLERVGDLVLLRPLFERSGASGERDGDG